MSDKLPRWSLEGIYPSPDSIEFERDIESVYELSNEIEEKSKDSKTPLLDLLELDDKATAICTNLYAYSSALLSTDSSNESYMKAVSKTEDASSSLSSAKSVMVYYVAKRSDEFSCAGLEMYKLKLDEIKVQAEHQMSIDEEKLASEFLKVSSSAWDRLQSAITSTIANGDKTLIELRGLATNKSREIREDAFYREISILKEHEVALAYALNGVKGTTLLLEKRRGWKDPIDRSLFSSRITRKALDALIGALEDSRAMFAGYLRTKAKLLGLEKMDFFDLFAPVGKSPKSYTFEEAKALVYDSYNSFSKEAGLFIKNAFDNNWIDAEPRKGKVGGAYDTAFPLKKESRILCNFDSSYDSVSTLAHELGHAFHDSRVKDMPISQSEYPMTLAETASIFGENLLFQHVLSLSTKDEQLPIIESYVQSACQVCIDILSRFYFERELFEERKNGELSANRLCGIMLEAEEKAYGDAIGVKHPYMWAVKGHYYSESFSFYNYPYAFGQLFALGLFALKDTVSDFPEHYNQILRLTGKMSANDVASSIGIDIEDKAFWNKGLGVIGLYIERLKEWI